MRAAASNVIQFPRSALTQDRLRQILEAQAKRAAEIAERPRPSLRKMEAERG